MPERQGEAAGNDLVAACEGAVRSIREAFAEPGALERTVRHRIGDVPGHSRPGSPGLRRGTARPEVVGDITLRVPEYSPTDPRHSLVSFLIALQPGGRTVLGIACRPPCLNLDNPFAQFIRNSCSIIDSAVSELNRSDTLRFNSGK